MAETLKTFTNKPTPTKPKKVNRVVLRLATVAAGKIELHNLIDQAVKDGGGTLIKGVITTLK